MLRACVGVQQRERGPLKVFVSLAARAACMYGVFSPSVFLWLSLLSLTHFVLWFVRQPGLKGLVGSGTFEAARAEGFSWVRN